MSQGTLCLDTNFHGSSSELSTPETPNVPRYALLTICSIVLACWIASPYLSRTRHRNGATYPWTLPVLKSTISFVFNGHALFQSIPRLFPGGETVKIEILGDEFYIIQGSKNIAEMLRSPVLTVTRAYSLVLEQCFGMQKNAVKAYLADTSGSRDKPIEGSNPRPMDRISYLTHQNLVEGLLTSGLPETTKNFKLNLRAGLQDAVTGEEWTAQPDLMAFFEQYLGTALLRTLYGQRLLDENPHLSKDIWIYDASVMDLARRVPSWWIPRAYALRDRLVSAIKSWHFRGLELTGNYLSHRKAFQEDPIWGSSFMRTRYHMLLGAAGQDDDSVASTNLALMWASITNVVPSSAALLIYVLQTPGLLSKVRDQIEALPSFSFPDGPSVEELEKVPLLLSIYAETLRLNVQIHIPRSTGHQDIRIGGTVVPRNKLLMTSVMLAHMDDSIWNTKDGARPLTDFWAERFLVDPKDASSGPTKTKQIFGRPVDDCETGVSFSTEGLEGVWIPFGGGQHACPGRILAKRIMLFTLAMLVTRFDFELLGEHPILFESPRFGFGVRKPVAAVPFRTRLSPRC